MDESKNLLICLKPYEPTDNMLLCIF